MEKTFHFVGRVVRLKLLISVMRLVVVFKTDFITV